MSGVGARGECERLIELVDWARTSLGPPEAWSPALRALVKSILRSRQPMLLFWGPDLVQFYNDAFVPSFGVGKHPDAMGQPAAECWKDAWPIVGAQIEAVMSRGEPAWHADALVPIHRNGRMEEVYWTYSYSPAYDEHGRIAGTLVIVTEMTERVVGGRRLAALARLGTSLANAQTRAQVLDAVCALVEREPSDLPLSIVGERNGAELALLRAYGAPPDVAQELAGAVAAARALPGTVEVRTPIVGTAWPEPIERMFVAELPSGRVSCGQLVAFGLSPRLPFDESYRSYLGQIIEQLAAALGRIDSHEASRISARERDDLLMSAPIAAALLVGADFVYQLANPRYCEIAGRDPTGQRFSDAFPELVGSETANLLEHVYRTGERVVTSEQRVLLERGGDELTDAYFNFVLEPHRGPTGSVLGVMIVAVDVTPQVLASRAKDEFLAMLGHELRNPLAPIAAAMELLKQRDSTDRHEIEVVERQLRHVTLLLDDLLDVARITRRTIEVVRSRVDLAVVARNAAEAVRPLIEGREHELSLSLEPNLIVHGDEARLTQVVCNLLTNAARYTPPGGHIQLRAQADGASAVLGVSDDGVGMSPELLKDVFELFVQGRRGLDRREGGLGIGLAIVKQLVTLHDGTVRASSAGPGRGSEVVVTLPLAAPAAASSAEPRARRELPRATSAKRIVIVDDNEDAALLLAELLRAFGHEIAVAHEPRAALDLIERVEPHIAILDIGLPGMDGYQLARHVRELPYAGRLFALTGYAHERDRALEAGFEAHFVKPVAVAELLSALE